MAALADAYDLLLCMTVNPGWGGQPYIERLEHASPELRELLPDGVPIEVDGGIDRTRPAPAAEGGRGTVRGGLVGLRRGATRAPP